MSEVCANNKHNVEHSERRNMKNEKKKTNKKSQTYMLKQPYVGFSLYSAVFS